MQYFDIFFVERNYYRLIKITNCINKCLFVRVLRISRSMLNPWVKVMGQTKNGFLSYIHNMFNFIFNRLYEKFL